MTHILFVCHGNICRSPMAEFIMKELIRRAGREGELSADSVAATTEEIGHDMYPPARRKLRAMGIPFAPRAARLITAEDAEKAAVILAMDEENLRHLRRRFGDRYAEKTHLLMEYTGVRREVADPWYTGDFDETYADILTGCESFLRAWQKEQ